MEIPFNAAKTVSFYSFGGYNYKSSDAFAYSRNYSAKPERFPTNEDGSLIFVPDIMRTSSDGEIYFNPHIQTHITDESIAVGIKGATNGSWDWDISNTLGRNDVHTYGDKTFNASIIGNSTPNHFDDGGFNFLQNTVNLDLSKPFKSVAQGLNLGVGAEFRYEKYEIYKGEEGSYKGYHPESILYQNIDEERTPAAGSQGFPGFSPSDVVSDSRTNIGDYVDA
jgi:iron complex outermembrane receptor protein